MDIARKRILCVDDSRDTRDLYTVVFSDYEVIPAGTVAEALGIARKNLLDLYLLDASLPDGTGIALCRQIRGFDPNTPVLFVSGVVDQSEQDEAINAGAQAYMIKPVPVFDLQVTAESLIREAASRSLEARCIENKCHQGGNRGTPVQLAREARLQVLQNRSRHRAGTPK